MASLADLAKCGDHRDVALTLEHNLDWFLDEKYDWYGHTASYYRGLFHMPVI